MENRAEEYRRRAERCLEMGPTFHNPQARDVLLQMAHVWLRLADKCEYANAMVGRSKTAEEAQPEFNSNSKSNPRRKTNRPPQFRALSSSQRCKASPSHHSSRDGQSCGVLFFRLRPICENSILTGKALDRQPSFCRLSFCRLS